MNSKDRVVVVRIRSTIKTESINNFDSALIAKKKFGQIANKEFKHFLHNWTVAYSTHNNSSQVLLYQDDKLTELIKFKN